MKFEKKYEILGEKFGRLTVASYVSGGFWQCNCVCGGSGKWKAHSLVTGGVRSCGCLNKDASASSRALKAERRVSRIELGELKKSLKYDRETGVFQWLISPRFNVKIGDLAGVSKSKGYLSIGLNGRVYRAHVLAWFYVYGVWPTGVIDHIDGNPQNNRIENLRDCSRAVNTQNQKQPHKGNKTGVLGVSMNGSKKNPFRAALSIDGKITYLGIYPTPELAHEAYLVAKRQFHPGCTI